MTITAVYTAAAAAYGRQFNANQCDAWNRVLNDFSPVEVQAAVEKWQQNTSEDFDGRTLGSKLPQPSDLRAICQRLREQELSRRTGEFVSCGECEDGWVRIFEGHTARNNPIDRKIGAVRMCQCREHFLCEYFHCTAAELPARLHTRQEEKWKQ